MPCDVCYNQSTPVARRNTKLGIINLFFHVLSGVGCPSSARATIRECMKGQVFVMSRYIELTKGYRALVSDCDYDRLSVYKLWVIGSKTKIYARGWVNQKRTLMHRYILNATHEQQVDHINGDTLDNRRENLRIATSSQNAMNRGTLHRQHGVTSEYVGVHWSKKQRRWRAVVWKAGQWYSAGSHVLEEDAARAYDNLARIHHGQFAHLNFPNEE
jgi:hypothetical protein